nr:serine-rich adhesin for platelets-like [Biomphalaria glabrata]
MSGAVKPRAPAPNSTPLALSKDGEVNGGVVQNGKTPPLQQSSSEVSFDDQGSDRVDGNVTLDVILPNGQRTDIIVDYSTPMLDLLVCLAGKCKMSPTGLALQILSEENGQPLTYKPNQMVGSLGGRVVRIVSKEELSGKSKNKKPEKQFEITQRFTINLLRGQKTVLRVSPLKTLADIVSEVCQDKGLDPRRHILQLPGNPGIPVDLSLTVKQIDIYEMNLVSLGLEERNHTSSMPNLTHVAPTEDRLHPQSSTREVKKKKGFLSFLKKDKKPKLSVQVNVDSNQNVSTLQTHKATTPPSQRYGLSSEKETVRPKSMFISGSQKLEDSISEPSKDKIQALPRKKRQAPAPPVPPQAQSSLNVINKEISKDNAVVSNIMHNNNNQQTISPITNRDEILPLPQGSREDLLNRLHSRNSSDSSGYHEITLSGCESPEATHHNASKFKISIDATSIESAEHLNGDGNAQDLPSKISPIIEVQERTEVPSKKSTSSSTGTLPSMKKKKAPAPPPPPTVKPLATSSPTPPADSSQIVVKADLSHVPAALSDKVNTQSLSVAVSDNDRTALPLHQTDDIVDSVTSLSVSVTQTPEVEVAVQSQTNEQVTATQPVTKVKEDSLHDEEFKVVDTVENVEEKKDVEKKENVEEKKNNVAIESGEHFDINDILESIVFDEEPKSLLLQISSYQSTNDEVVENDKETMLMMETSSVTSEDIEELVISSSLERPCAFIPPPPPTEPPPPEDVEEGYEGYEPVFVDKGTEVNDDNTSLAPLSAKSSPSTAHKKRDSIVSLSSIDTIESLSLDFEQAILLGEEACFAEMEVTSPGYKNEMALFVERMSKIAMQSNHETSDDTTSISVLSSDTNSDTGSVIRHFRSDSKDSKSESEPSSLTRIEGKKIGSVMGIGLNLENDWHEVPMPGMEIHTDALPPPPEFNDECMNNDLDLVKKVSVENEEEEEYKETIEELIVPLGPNGYDFKEAKKISVEEPKLNIKAGSVSKENISGVFRAEPLAISSMPHLPTLVHHNKPKTTEPHKVQKEEFILTNEDLSSISFLPPKVLKAKVPVETTPLVKVSRSSVLLDNSGSLNIKTSEPEKPLKDVRVQATNRSSVSVKTFPLNSLPAMRVSRLEEFTDDDPSNHKTSDPVANRSAPRLLVKASVGNMKPSYDDIDGGVSGPGSVTQISTDSLDPRRLSQSNTSPESPDQGESFATLKAQLSQWEDQLAKNKNLVSKVIHKEPTKENAPENVFQEKTQTKSLLSLVKVSKAIEQSKVEVKAAPTAVPPPPPFVQLKKVGSESVKSKPQPKSKFQKELDPREQLMFAIRNFNSKESLKTVPVKQTHWV